MQEKPCPGDIIKLIKGDMLGMVVEIHTYRDLAPDLASNRKYRGCFVLWADGILRFHHDESFEVLCSSTSML